MSIVTKQQDDKGLSRSLQSLSTMKFTATYYISKWRHILVNDVISHSWAGGVS